MIREQRPEDFMDEQDGLLTEQLEVGQGAVSCRIFQEAEIERLLPLPVATFLSECRS